MLVRDCMSEAVLTVSPEMTLSLVAQKLREEHFGLLPVVSNFQVVGVLSTRDILVGCVAKGLDAKNLSAADVMTKDVVYCFEDQDVATAAYSFSENMISRMPVLNRLGDIVGIITLSDIKHPHEKVLNDTQSLSEILPPINCF